MIDLLLQAVFSYFFPFPVSAFVIKLMIPYFNGIVQELWSYT